MITLGAYCRPFSRREEPLGGFRIPSVLHEDIEDHAALIHGTPQIMLNALDPDEHLIEVPLVARLRPLASQTIGKALTKFVAPAPHRLIGNDDTPLSQKQFHIAQAEAEHVVQPHGMADNLRGEAVAVVRVAWRFMLPASLTPTTPASLVTGSGSVRRDLRRGPDVLEIAATRD